MRSTPCVETKDSVWWLGDRALTAFANLRSYKQNYFSQTGLHQENEKSYIRDTKQKWRNLVWSEAWMIRQSHRECVRAIIRSQRWSPSASRRRSESSSATVAISLYLKLGGQDGTVVIHSLRWGWFNWNIYIFKRVAYSSTRPMNPMRIPQRSRT